jgi:dUTP pyrophosphatase
MILKVKILHEKAITPQYRYSNDSGFDIGPCRDVEILPGWYATFGVGIAVEIPDGHEIQIRPRGSTSTSGLQIYLGTVDEGYRGEMNITVFNPFGERIMWPAGTRVAQCVVVPVARPTICIVDELSLSLRGVNWNGSTGER